MAAPPPRRPVPSPAGALLATAGPIGAWLSQTSRSPRIPPATPARLRAASPQLSRRISAPRPPPRRPGEARALWVAAQLGLLPARARSPPHAPPAPTAGHAAVGSDARS